MDASIIHIHEDPLKWALAGLTAYLGVHLDVESLVWFTYIVFLHSILGAMKSVRVARTIRALSLARFMSGVIKYVAILLLLLMVSLTAQLSGLRGYNLMARAVVFSLSGILLYYSVVNVRGIFNRVDYRKEDLIEVFFIALERGSKALAKFMLGLFGK